MDDSGIKYEKYMQGQPAAMKFQEKVLPEGSYQKYIPLSQNGKASVQENFAPEAVLAAVKSEKRDDSKGKAKAKDKDESTAENAGNSEMDFQRYLHQPSPGPVVDRKYGKYVPSKYSDYIPEMDDSGIKYEKYMQGQPAAMKFQEKVLPEGSYQKYIPLSENGKASVQENFAPEAVLAAAKSEKRDDSKGKAKDKDKDESTAENAGNSEMDFQRYLHQPSPGPVVDRKYGKYVPSKYSDYIPEMDDSGIKYEKYMQGQPAAMKFQEKVLPEGSYQKYIPLSQNGKASVQENFAPEAVLAAAKSERRDDSKGKAKAKDKDESTAENAGNSEMDFQRYLHQPSPGPVVDRKYGKYVPSKYSDYIPEMDDSGIKYEKYMQGQPAAMKFQEKVLPEGSYQKYIPLSQNGKASVQENFAPEAVLAAAKSEKRDDSKGKAKAKDKDESTAENAGNSEMDFQRYLHQPSPGPVVDRKYGKYVPSKYSDYIPEMDDSGIKYEKYMQGQPAAMKFQEKVLPEGSYQKYIPLSQNGKASVQENFAPEAVLAAVKSEKRDDSKGKAEAKDKDESTAENAGNSEMDFQRYLHQPSPGPVVDRKYGKYVPSKYGDYIPEMDDSGIKYEKYMPDKGTEKHRAGSSSRGNVVAEDCFFECKCDGVDLRHRYNLTTLTCAT